MADWNLPGLTDLYTNFLAYIKARDDDAVRLNDSRVLIGATNLPNYAKRWNHAYSRFENWLTNAWSPLVVGQGGGGTGASTWEDARTNLDVYSKAEADAKYALPLTAETNTLGSNLELTTDNVYYDGPSVVLSPGMWLILGTANYHIQSGSPSVSINTKLWDGTTTYKLNYYYYQGTYVHMFPAVVNLIGTFNSTTTIRLAARRSGGASSLYMIAGNSYINAVRLA